MPVNRDHTNKTSDWIASKIPMFNIIMRRDYVNLILIKLLHVYGHVNQTCDKMLSKYPLLILETRLKSKLLAAGNNCLYLF